MADWRTDLCSRIRAPASADNLKAFDLWARSEAQEVRKHNPLGARPYDFDKNAWASQDAVLSFDTIGHALDYYERLLRTPRFSEIRNLLRAKSTLLNLWYAISGSLWRPLTFQSGHYPVLLYRLAVEPVLAGEPPGEPLSQLAHDFFHAWHNLTHELHHHTARELARARTYSRRMHSAVR